MTTPTTNFAGGAKGACGECGVSPCRHSNLTTIEAIRAKCVEANPEIVVELGMAPDAGDVMTEERPIRLADVLLAIHASKTPYGTIDICGDMRFEKYASFENHEVVRWNLRNDDLEAQSPETIGFIGKILGV